MPKMGSHKILLRTMLYFTIEMKIELKMLIRDAQHLGYAGIFYCFTLKMTA